MGTRYLDVADYLLVAEVALGVEAAAIQRVAQLGLADSALAAPAAEFGGIDSIQTSP